MDRTILGRSDGRARASLGRRRARRALVADLQLAQPLPQLVALLLALLLSATTNTTSLQLITLKDHCHMQTNLAKHTYSTVGAGRILVKHRDCYKNLSQ